MSQDLQIYQVSLDIAALEVDRLWQFLSEEERSRADRYKREYLKRNFVAARGNLRVILAQWLACEPQEIVFSYSDRGKPYIAKMPKPPYFNMSHSGDLAIYAVCSDREVGIDVEYINLNADVDSIANRYFLRSEQQVLQRLGDRAKHLANLAFYQAWTLKEAYGKATGQGIAHILDRIDVSPLLESPLGESLELDQWILKILAQEVDIGTNYTAALCISACAN
ncbi:4'-phosphopantetheinyl transferase superfamily protein [Pseudanabaena sp. FACHB-1998]|uniref:4'-phosphopantetheinyl transferase family protein n=1 Tax=Pseudanabaena sp. FACHB-1998 TaxID=2692858 RepID=UPI001681C175|nr:4'-phosphopantetheinyl transferase superfamily protein [Pseudanabaena sp. FACHB-1998]MBD2177270.1 4'-phosphopantetheinyl transferase superfamily protein [Pseudanabaena sp. FACHB-1998]